MVLGWFTTCLVVLGPVASVTAQSPSAEPSASATATSADGRFVLPEGGYAVRFPQGWTVDILPIAGEDVPVVRAQAPDDPVTGAVGGFCEVKVSAPCDGSCAGRIEEAAEREVAWWESRVDAPVPATVESTVLPVPGLDVVRVWTQITEPASDRAMDYLTDGRVIATLLCIADDGPDDHWLSVVDTFSFLP